jgi:microcystin-dependent protein
MATTGYSFTELARLADIDFKRIGVPMGTIFPYYGISAPAGFLPCDGRKIVIDAYPELVDHLIGMRKSKVKTTVPVTLTGSADNNWVNGLNDNLFDYGQQTGARGITWASTSEQSVNTTLSDKIVTPEDNTNIIAKLGWTYQDYTYTVEMVLGTWEQFKAAVAGKAVDVYNSLTDIPLDDAVYLPDLRGQYLSGYDSRTARFVGTGEGDAIRNFTGQAQMPTDATTGALPPVRSGSGVVRTEDAWGGSVDSITWSSTDKPAKKFSLDASRVVPTDTTNHPSNVNFLYVIKAYDTITDPEQLAAKVVVDKVNKNEADITPLKKRGSVRLLGSLISGTPTRTITLPQPLSNFRRIFIRTTAGGSIIYKNPYEFSTEVLSAASPLNLPYIGAAGIGSGELTYVNDTTLSLRNTDQGSGTADDGIDLIIGIY